MKRLVWIDDEKQRVVPVEPTDEMEVAAENHYESTGATFPDWKGEYRAMLAAAPAVEEAQPVKGEGWLQEGSLLYRLTKGPRTENKDEINVTMVDGSRDESARIKRASQLLMMISEESAGGEKRNAEEFPRFTLSGHELLAALDFIAPDRDTPEHADQLDGEVTIQYGDGHTGKGYYAWCTDYADEGSVFLSTPAEGEPAPAIAAASKGDKQ
ncbi:hypothetical protein [Robbsia andropogonis]|uniref:hypothetical protein n=1 Tax=Robbsia andropogonis TaxID=28092 RepID=UPI00209D572E|nr:hypothetical protein [Robbsia andropogonis]MCP1117009.1 hypothetical protein [Robbsia andropogonis]MCP1126312.1 hypothetical protein [Robbsia andropogonis]